MLVSATNIVRGINEVRWASGSMSYHHLTTDARMFYGQAIIYNTKKEKICELFFLNDQYEGEVVEPINTNALFQL